MRDDTAVALAVKFHATVTEFLRSRYNQRESVSFLRSHLRNSGWRGLGSSVSDFETLLEDAGFKLERVYTKQGANLRMTWVHLPDWRA